MTALECLLEVQARIGTRDPFNSVWRIPEAASIAGGGRSFAWDCVYGSDDGRGDWEESGGLNYTELFDTYPRARQQVILEKAIYKAQQDLL